MCNVFQHPPNPTKQDWVKTSKTNILFDDSFIPKFFLLQFMGIVDMDMADMDMVDMGIVDILKDNTHSWEHLSLVDLAASSKLLPRGKSWKCRWGF